MIKPSFNFAVVRSSTSRFLQIHYVFFNKIRNPVYFRMLNTTAGSCQVKGPVPSPSVSSVDVLEMERSRFQKGHIWERQTQLENDSTPRKIVPKVFAKSLREQSRIVRGLRKEFSGIFLAHEKEALDQNELSPFKEAEEKHEENKLDVLFGIHPVKLALKSSRRTFHQLFVKLSLQKSATSIDCAADTGSSLKQIFQLAKAQKIPIKISDVNTLNRLCYHNPHQGVCLVSSKLKPGSVTSERMDELLKTVTNLKRKRLWLFLDHILDPMNCGSILRSAYFFGVDQIFIPDKGSCKLSPVVSKASSGVLEVCNVNTVTDAAEFLTKCRQHGIKIIGTTAQSTTSATPVYSAKLGGPIMLLMGSEGSGISEELRSYADEWIMIPSLQKDELISGEELSLNVGVATGIVLQQLAQNNIANMSEKALF